MEDYDPTYPEIRETEGNNKRPTSWQGIFWRSKLGNIFQVWPERQLQVVQYGKYYLRWSLQDAKKVHPNLRYYYSSQEKIVFKEISIDKETWLGFNEICRKPSPSAAQAVVQPLPPKPEWWNEAELLDEVTAKHKEFIRNRNRMLAQRRREKLKMEAEKAGMEYNEYKTQKTRKNQKERIAKQRTRTGKKLADTLNRKIKLAMVLKDLSDETAGLREKLEDETKTDELDLTYIVNKVDKLKAAIRVLKEIDKAKSNQ